jgi:hypothetical protein
MMRLPLPILKLWRQPLLRLLAINLAGGIVIAIIAVGGLLLVSPADLRRLIFEDQSPGLALLLLLFGFAVSFASASMGTAIMGIGRD